MPAPLFSGQQSARYGIISKTLDVSNAVDRGFTAISAGSN